MNLEAFTQLFVSNRFNYCPSINSRFLSVKVLKNVLLSHEAFAKVATVSLRLAPTQGG